MPPPEPDRSDTHLDRIRLRQGYGDPRDRLPLVPAESAWPRWLWAWGLSPMDPDERKFAEFAQRQRRVEVFDSAGSAISAVVVACVAWLGQVPDVIRVLANAVRAWSVAKSVRRSEPIAQPGANPAVAAVAELERFGRRLSKILPPDARHRLYEPCIQDMLTEFRNSVDKDKRSGADKVKFIRRQLWWFKFKMALEVLICLRLAATDWIVGVMRRK